MLSEKDKKGVMLIVTVVCVVAALFAARLVFGTKPGAGSDNCVGKPLRSTVLLIDHSEQITVQTRAEIEARAFRHILENVQINERVSVFAASELSKASLVPLVSLCRPPDDGNRFTESVQAIKKKFTERFEKPVKQALATPISGGKESPIAQAVTDISLSQYMRSEANTLIIFSDMLEHTPKFTMYGCSDPASIVSKYLVAAKGTKERPTFKNAAVILNLVPRRDQAKSVLACRDKFWPWFFGDNSGLQSGLTLDFLPG